MNKRIAGLIIISVALTSMFIWELWGRENLYYQEVLVLKEDKASGTIIKREDLTTAKFENPAPKVLLQNDAEGIIGMETVQFVPGKTELRKEFFCDSKYNTEDNKGRHILCITEDWVLSFPKGIRRGDEVSLYNGNKKILEAVVIHAYDSAGREVISKDGDRLISEGIVSRIEIVSSAEKLVKLSSLAGKGKKLTMLYD